MNSRIAAASLTTPLPHRRLPRRPSTRASPRLLVVVAGEARAVAREQRRRDASKLTPSLPSPSSPSPPLVKETSDASSSSSPSSPSTQLSSPGAPAVPTKASTSRPSPQQVVAAAVAASRQDFDAIDALIAHNVRRTQEALSSSGVRLGAHHFAGSTGYGRGDAGRAALDAAVAALVGGGRERRRRGNSAAAADDEDDAAADDGFAAVARPHFVSGTHAIAAALFGALRPGDELLAVAGKPYDTLDPVIGIGKDDEEDENGDEEDEERRSSSSSSSSSSSNSNLGSLADWGVSFRALPLDPHKDGGGTIDWKALETCVRPNTRVALIQRSCGYSSERATLSVAEIERAAVVLKAAAKKINNQRLVVAVDNCYGEFTEEREPGSCEGVDLVMGSFIKGFGGTVAPCGGYVFGRKELVTAAAARATAPGVGIDYGAIEGSTLRLLFQGLWLAPHVVGEAMKGGRVVARVMAAEGYGGVKGRERKRRGGKSDTSDENDAAADDDCRDKNKNNTEIRPPPGSPPPFPFVTCVPLLTAKRLVAFCRAVQEGSPVGSFVLPTPGPAAGCSDAVVFGDGTFVDGSTGEMSADGPLRPPFAVYTQGGAHWSQWVVPLERAVEALRRIDDEEEEEEGEEEESLC